MCLKRVVAIGFFLHLFHGSIQLTDREYALMPQLFHLDDFDHCRQLEEDFLYCHIDFHLYPKNKTDPPKVWNIIQEAHKRKNSYRHDIIRHGLCVPESCPKAMADPKKDLEKIQRNLGECYREKYAHLELTGDVQDIRCETQEDPYPITFLDYVFAVFIYGYIAFVMYASYYEGQAGYKTKEEYEKITGTFWGKFLSAFSLKRNWDRLKHVNYDDPNIKALSSLQGIRFYNMILVIATHTFMINMGGPVSNPLYVENMDRKFLSVFFENGGYVVQTFFMISAWLMMYQFLVHFENKKEIPAKFLFWSFVHRYIRLTPAFAIVLMYNATWMVHVERGPFWGPIVGDEYRRCRNHGWANLLYVNNYYKETEMCMPHTWYMAVDTQFFALGLFVLWYTWGNVKRFFTVTIGLVVLHVAILFYLIYSNDWEFTFRAVPEELYLFRVMENHQWHQILGSNYGHLPGLPAGLMFGYFYYKYRNTSVFTKKIHVALFWLASWGGALGIIVIPGSFIHYCPLYKHVRLYDALYGCISRTIFIFGIAICIFGMSQGVGWAMRWVCQWKPSYVLGRLSYSSYLVHMVFLRLRGAHLRQPQFLADFLLVGDIIGDLAISFLGGLLLTLFFEMPLSQLQKSWLPKRQVKKADFVLDKPPVKPKKIN